MRLLLGVSGRDGRGREREWSVNGVPVVNSSEGAQRRECQCLDVQARLVPWARVLVFSERAKRALDQCDFREGGYESQCPRREPQRSASAARS